MKTQTTRFKEAYLTHLRRTKEDYFNKLNLTDVADKKILEKYSLIFPKKGNIITKIKHINKNEFRADKERY